MSETADTRRLCQVLTECGALCFAIVGSEMQGRGWPDRFISHPILGEGGVWIEFKAMKGKLAPIQRARLEKLLATKCRAVVGRFVDGGLIIEDPWGNDQGYVPHTDGRAFLKTLKEILERFLIQRSCGRKTSGERGML